MTPAGRAGSTASLRAEAGRPDQTLLDAEGDPGLSRPTRLLDTRLSTCRGPAPEGRCWVPAAQRVLEQRKAGQPTPTAPRLREAVGRAHLSETASGAEVRVLHTAEGHCWPCTAPRARGRPSSPPTAASGQTRAPPAKPSAPRQPVSVPVLPRNQVRVLLNHPCTAARWRSPRRQSPGTPPGPATLVQPLPSATGSSCRPRDMRPASGRARPGPQGRRPCVR